MYIHMSKLMFDFLNTTYNIRNGKHYFYHYNEFVHIQNFENLFLEIVGALLVFDVLKKMYIYI